MIVPNPFWREAIDIMCNLGMRSTLGVIDHVPALLTCCHGGVRRVAAGEYTLISRAEASRGLMRIGSLMRISHFLF